MWIFSYDNGDTVMATAAGPSKSRIYAFAQKYITEWETDAPTKYRLVWRDCEDGEYTIEDSESGEIYGYLSNVRGVK